ncbi:MAG: aspartate kinase, partial [Clostridia bacterium]|nr:aspartate kinase [Clostridia bacterium]
KYKVDHTNVLSGIQDRYQEIVDGLKIDLDVAEEFRVIDENLKNGAVEDYLVSRGEYLNAKIMAKVLGYDFVDAYGSIYFNYDKSIDTARTNEALKMAFASAKNGVVVPGFFGTMPDGQLALMSRGGSDITGALLAAALEADVYENWTDVPGILMADPGIVDNPKPIPNITYDELRELTYMGAKVLHEAAVKPVKDANIPLNIRDTNNPQHPGTLIAESFEIDKDDEFYITGIAGKKGYCVIDVHYENLATSVGAYTEVLKVLEKRNVYVEQILSGVDDFSLIVRGSYVKPFIYALVSEIEAVTGEGSVKVTENLSMIACVSRMMVFKPGISGKIFTALGDNNINIRMISQGAEELNIIIGVDDKNYDNTIRVLYDSFTKKN